MKTIPLAVLLAFAAAGSAFAGESTALPPPGGSAVASGLLFAGDVPDDFADAVFDTPLAVRIEVDGRYLADAMVVLDRAQHLHLTQMLEGADSAFSLDIRQDYETLLRKGIKLGACSGFECPGGIVRSAFSLADSKLALFTDHATAAADHYYSTPRHGTGGLLIDHGLSLVTSPTDSSSSLNYNVSLTSNIGSWTAYSGAQFDYYRYPRADGRLGGEQWRKYLNDLYLQKEFRGYYVRGGYFTPDTSTDQGNLAPLPYSNADTIVGFSVGSSDTLFRSGKRPSMVPLTVSVTKAGRAELYKNGRLLATYPTQPGINSLPTENLPDGVYNVEVRVFEDGHLTSSVQESIYKPSNWNGESRWRYRVYGGRRLSLLDGLDYDVEPRSDWVGGVQLGYMFTPKLHAGITVTHDGIDVPVGLFVDYQFNDNFRFYFNPYYSAKRGSGFEIQGTARIGEASLSFTHRYSQRKYSRRLWPYGSGTAPIYTDISRYSQLTGSWQVNQANRLSASLSYDHVNSRRTVDVSWYHDLKWPGTNRWQSYISLYDRPSVWTGYNRYTREYGVMVGLTGTFGRGNNQVNASLGAGQADKGLDRSLNLNYQHMFADGAVKSVNVAGNYASSGSSATASAQFANRVATGDGYVQYGTVGNSASFGLNMQSTSAIGGGAVVQAAPSMGHAESAVLLNVDSDDGMPANGMVAHLSDGGDVHLHSGTNLISVDPYEVEHLSFDLGDNAGGGVRFRPESSTVQLYPGGVARQKVEAMRTVTVVGRIVGADGKPKTGIQIRNHAGTAWPENDGVFTLEVSRKHPTIDVLDGKRNACTFDIHDRMSNCDENGAVVLGDLKCN